MAFNPSKVAENLARAKAALRMRSGESRQMTIAQLSELTGMPRSTLIHIVKANPRTFRAVPVKQLDNAKTYELV